MNRTRLTSSSVNVPDSLEAVYQEVVERRWGDGLPVIPPTEDRVYAMLDFVGQPPDKLVGEMPPAQGEATLEKLAINAVMAGCLPEYFPVVIAAVEAMLEPQFNLFGIQDTTNPVGPLLIVNGPIRKKLNINCTRGCMGPGWRANATIGRAIRLILINIGGALPAEVSKSIHGMPGRYTFCFGEDEEGNPWEPLHVERGFKKEDSTVTVAGVQGTHNAICANVELLSSAFLKLAANSMATMGNNNMMVGIGEPLFVFTSGHAEQLVKDGFSKADVKRFLFEHVKVPLSQFPPEIQAMSLAQVPGQANLEYRWRAIDGMVQPCQSADDIMIVVAGASNPYHLVAMPTFGDTRSVTKKIVTKS